MLPLKPVVAVISITVVLIILAGFFGLYLGARNIIRPPVGAILTVPAVAYAPSPHQTDATPCRTASGTRPRPGTLATNFLPFGTIVQAEPGGKFYIVEDRMNPRYDRVVDIFFPSTSEALAFGRKTLQFTIIEYGTPGQALPGEDQKVQDDTAVSRGTAVDTSADPALLQRWLGGINYLQRLLRAGTPNVNRYDINCDE